MPDIAMCKGTGKPHSEDKSKSVDCPKKEMCFRFKATPSEFRQAYFIGIPYDPVTNKCTHFMSMDEEEAVEALDGPVTNDVAEFIKRQRHDD